LEEKWKLMLPQAGDEVELYEVLSDPREERNVASGQPEVVARLTKKLDAWWNGY
jgi:hypothetical protein